MKYRRHRNRNISVAQKHRVTRRYFIVLSRERQLARSIRHRQVVTIFAECRRRRRRRRRC